QAERLAGHRVQPGVREGHALGRLDVEVALVRVAELVLRDPDEPAVNVDELRHIRCPHLGWAGASENGRAAVITAWGNRPIFGAPSGARAVATPAAAGRGSGGTRFRWWSAGRRCRRGR